MHLRSSRVRQVALEAYAEATQALPALWWAELLSRFFQLCWQGIDKLEKDCKRNSTSLKNVSTYSNDYSEGSHNVSVS